jgi:hypothetical protein
MVQVLGSSIVSQSVELLASRAWDPDIAAWIRRSVPRHLRRDPAILVSVRSNKSLSTLLAAEGLGAEARLRVEAAHAAGDRVAVPGGSGLKSFMDAARDMVDWLTSLPSDDRHLRRIDRMSVTDALNLSDRWHRRMAADAAMLVAGGEGTRAVKNWEDGVRIVELASPAALKHEGSSMGHCVGGYWHRVQKGDCRIFSLRDAGGTSHATIEVGHVWGVDVAGKGKLRLSRRPLPGLDLVPLAATEAVVLQTKGRGNVDPAPRWSKRVDEFLTERGWHEVALPSAETIAVYTVAGKHWDNARDALADAAGMVASRKTGTDSIIRAIPADVDQILASASVEDRSLFSRRLLSAAGRKDAGTAVRSQLFSGIVSTIDVVAHALPLGSMELLAADMAGDAGDKLFSRVGDVLAAILDAMENDPGSIHGYSLAPGCGVTPGIVSSMFLATGLASRREAACAKTATGLLSAIRNMREEARVHARRSSGRTDVERSNYLANMLAGDVVSRLAGMAVKKIPGLVLLASETGPRSGMRPAASVSDVMGPASRRMAALVGGRPG